MPDSSDSVPPAQTGATEIIETALPASGADEITRPPDAPDLAASAGSAPTPAPVAVRLAQCLDVLDKQYRLYSWNDSKALSLITTDSVLFAAIGFLFAACLPDMLATIFLGSALSLISVSLIVVLRQVIPQGSSGKSGQAPNFRSLRGICSFSDWESYRDHCCNCSEEQFAEDAIRQAYGMAINNDKSRATIRLGVMLTLVGIVCLIAAAVAASLSARNVHALGVWAVPATKTEEPSQPKPFATATGVVPENENRRSSAPADPAPTKIIH